MIRKKYMWWLAWNTNNAQGTPVQKIAQPLRAITLDDALAAIEPGEFHHEAGQLLDAVLQANVATIHDVDAVGLGIADVFLHEATETGQVGGHAGNSHHRALGGGVTPGLVVRGEDTQVAATDELLVVDSEQGIGRREELRMEDHLDTLWVYIILDLTFKHLYLCSIICKSFSRFMHFQYVLTLIVICKLLILKIGKNFWQAYCCNILFV